MRKIMQWMLAAILICGTAALTGCKKDKEDEPSGADLAQKIVGKWLYVESDGALVATSESSVTTFALEGSTLKAYTSQSLPDYGLWVHNQPTEVVMDDNKITLTVHAGDLTTVEEMTNISVVGDNMNYTSKYTILRNGEVIEAMGPYQLRCMKVQDDYSQIFIGRWEGEITSNEPGFTPKPFCEEYHADGTNTEYELKDGQWVEVEAEYAEYFIDGTLLCTRWRYPGQAEERENSIFMSYDDDSKTIILIEMVARGEHLYTETSTLKKAAAK